VTVEPEPEVSERPRRDAAVLRRLGRYDLDAVRAYFQARWGGTLLGARIADAVQDVVGGCFDGATPDGGTRRHVLEVTRSVAEQVEARGAGDVAEPEARPVDPESLDWVFHRTWARATMRETADRMRDGVPAEDEAARDRLELLRLRFEVGRPVSEVAREWGRDAAELERELEEARRTFGERLAEVVASQRPPDVTAECVELLNLLI